MTTSGDYANNEKRKIFDDMASKIPGAKRTKKGVLIPLKGKGNFYHITDMHKLNTEEHKKYGDEWLEYKVICDINDYEDIISLKTQSDYLLKLRAESILDNMRVLRVFQSRFKNSDKMTLSKWYSKYDKPNTYIENISKGAKSKLVNIPAGTAMLKRSNAICMSVPPGNIIVVSEKLIYALYFFNIFIYGESLGFTTQEAITGLTIALRTFYGHETLDFDMDTRGEFDKSTEMHLQKLLSNQYNFILGHEYAHHLLGHLNDSKLFSERMFLNESKDKVHHYIHKYKEEYDADWFSIKNITGNKDYKNEIANAAFTCFFFFYTLELVGEYLAPQGDASAKSHPPAMDRLFTLRRKLKANIGHEKEHLEAVKSSIDSVMDYYIKELLPFNMDDFEKYGSYYFERFKPLRLSDRIDY